MALRHLLVLAVSASVGGWYAAPFFGLGARVEHLPGPLTDGHYQLEAECEACHEPFAGATNARCLTCHGEALAASEDSHSESKFTDPRNAERSGRLNAAACTTCHAEHVPARTRRGGVTLPADLCMRCHDDVATERPSHAGFDRESCARSGCHNFHDNRALYADFLVKHGGEVEVLAAPRVLVRSSTAAAEAAPSPRCEECHAEERAGFLRGRHGMRLARGLSPMRPGDARTADGPDGVRSRLTFEPAAAERTLGCTTCHGAHANDTRRAAVEACLECHADRHSRAYRASKHYALLEAERAGRAPPGSGVSCATCHLPRRTVRRDGRDVVVVEHDQNANLRPSTKMIRTVCSSCHGLALSLDALADDALVERCFDGRPATHVESIDLATRRARDRPNGKEQKP